MDALSDLLRVVGLSGGVFLEARFTAPWCLAGNISAASCRPFMATPAHIIAFHYVVDGACKASVEGEEAATLAGGDVIMFPGNAIHKLGSRLDIQPTEAGEIVRPTDVGVMRIEHGGGGEPCHIVCGFLGGDEQIEPLIATLPAMMKMTVRDTPGGEWMSHSFRYGAEQLAKADPGAATVMSKMSELLFVEALRRYLTTISDEHTGFLAGLRDPAIGKALALMHTQVAREWTAEDLAEAVHLSRSAFCDRFAALIGQPPIRYLTNWRMQIAAHKLREGKLSIGQIAFDIGYDSEASFTRAFKREIGVPPATWRRRAYDTAQ